MKFKIIVYMASFQVAILFLKNTFHHKFKSQNFKGQKNLKSVQNTRNLGENFSRP